jgi:hypothetical protein
MTPNTTLASGIPVRRSLPDRVEDLVQRIEYRNVREPAELERIYRLRYDAYLREGAIAPREDKRLEDKFDREGHGKQIALYVEGRMVAAIRIHVAAGLERPTPATESFPDALAEPLARGCIIIDPNRFVVDHMAARGMPELPFATLRLAFMAAEHFQADLVSATVRKEHKPFYKRELHLSIVCAPRPYPTLIKPLGLMLVDYKKEGPSVLRRRPFYASSSEERTKIFGRPMNSRQQQHASHAIDEAHSR